MAKRPPVGNNEIGIGSPRARTPRQRIRILSEKFGPLVKTLRTAKQPSQAKVDKKKRNQLAGLLVRNVTYAAEQLGLDLDDPKDRLWLLMMLATAVFGAKPRGRKKEWDDERYAQLLADVDQIKRTRPDLRTEALICQELIRGKSKLARYAIEKSPSTLRRKLQDAKRRAKEDAKRKAQGASFLQSFK
jgi:hypothetical protein